MKYKIEWLNGDVLIENPTIEIIGLETRNPQLHANPDFINNIIGLDLYLHTPQTRFFLPLSNISVKSMVLDDGALLYDQVLSALNEQYGIID